MSAMLSTITRSAVHIRYIQSVLKAQHEGVIGQWMLRPCSMYLTNGRNDLIRNFLPTSHDKMLMVDSDIAFTPEDAQTVLDQLSEETPVVGGWYNGLLEDGTMVPVAYALGRDDETDEPGFYQLMEDDLVQAAAGHPLGEETPSDDPTPDPVVQVGGIGTGFLGIHRSLMEAMPSNYAHPCEWFAEPVMGGRMVGEDLGFCARVNQMGYPIHLHTDVHVLHFKELPI